MLTVELTGAILGASISSTPFLDEFANKHAAYDSLPAEIKTKLDGMTPTHDFEKFWEHMCQRMASGRPSFT